MSMIALKCPEITVTIVDISEARIAAVRFVILFFGNSQLPFLDVAQVGGCKVSNLFVLYFLTLSVKPVVEL